LEHAPSPWQSSSFVPPCCTQPLGESLADRPEESQRHSEHEPPPRGYPELVPVSVHPTTPLPPQRVPCEFEAFHFHEPDDSSYWQ
jgi:hypothetical protein